MDKSVLAQFSKIMVITPSDFPGIKGDAAFYHDLVVGLKRKGLDVILICPWNRKGKNFDRDMHKKGIDVVRIPFLPPRLPDVTRSGFGARVVIKLLIFYFVEISIVLRTSITRSPKICIIRHAILTLPLARLLRAMRIRSVADGEVLFNSLEHDLVAPRHVLRTIYAFEKISLYNLYRAQTEKQLDVLCNLGFPRNRIILTGIGTDLSKIPFYDIEQIPAATFGYFGALERWQGVDLLIKSFVKVARQKDCAKLYIIGDGSLKKELERSSEILGIKEQTVFCGAVSRETLWKEYFKFFRVAVIPRRVSGGERASIKLVEALAAGKPVIATSEEGIKEMVGKKGGVMFVPPEDDEMMASAMMLLCEDGSRLLGMSHEALKTAQQFDIDLLIDRLLGSVAKKLKRLA